MKKILLVGCLLCGISVNSYADITESMLQGPADSGATSSFKSVQDAERYNFADNQTIAVHLSIDDQNRIIVQDDRIKEIICAKAGYCSKIIDQKDGDTMFGLGPNALVNKPFSALVKTEDGRAFYMLIIPEHSMSKTVIFTPTTGGSKSAEKIEADSQYSAILSKIITTMVKYPNTKKSISGYSVTEVPITLDEAKVKKMDLLVYPVRAFRGSNYVGITYAVKNTTSHKLALNPKNFYKSGVLAGAVSTEILEPQQIGYSYQVWTNYKGK